MAFKPSWLLYGATGSAGSLIARAAVAAGSNVILAGRSEDKLRKLGSELGVGHRTVDLADRDGVGRALTGVRLVLNCAAPFSLSSTTLAAGCIRTGAHYLDIGGGMADHRALLRIDERARDAGVTVCPGVGFEVMLTDCLAVHLQKRQPSAVRIDLGIALRNMTLTRSRLGNLRDSLTQPGHRVLRGELVAATEKPATRRIDFGTGGTRRARAFPWRADALAATRSTGIGHVEFWASYPFSTDVLIAWHKAFDTGPLKRWLDWEMAKAPLHPPAKELQSGRSYVWGEAVNEAGTRVSSVLEGPSTYRITTTAALLAVERALSGKPPEGYVTPSQLVGPDALAAFTEVQCTDR